nr:redox-sensing transcriptional repressor Rex [Clostridiales bacterium]
GQYGYGYGISYLKDALARILGIDHTYEVIIIGAGFLGKAIANHAPTEKPTFIVQALFDIDPQCIGTVTGGVPILDMQELEEYLSKHHIDIAVLTLPPGAAPGAAERLARAGVSGIWNFSSVDLKVTVPEVVIENVHLSDSLMTLSYYLNHK